MTIRVIQQTTAERNQETQELFQQIRPYLDQGYGYYTAVRKATGRTPNNYKNGWYRALIDYGETQGYHYYRQKGGRR
jgi:hypothetical protein